MDQHEGIQRQPDMNPPGPNATPPADNRDEPPDVEEDLTLGQWFVRNGPILVLLALLLGFLFMKFDYDGLWSIAKVVVGLGFVIFIHELGHFLVAKWCDVHVTVFSIGFGPAIPGCRFQWGETTYKVALIPLGGYVQMVGQVDVDESSDGSEEDPRSYRNKTVWQRMAIISAGVIMNALLAIVCFIIVFQGPGKDRQAAVIDGIDSGAPAFIYGVRTGAEILQIDDIEHPYFEQLMVRVMATMRGEELTFISKRPEDKAPQVLEMEPRLDRFDKRPMFGISPSSRLRLASRRAADGFDAPAHPGSAAARATPPFEFGDVIVGVTHPDHPDDPEKMALPPDPRKPEQRDYFEFARRMQRLAGKPVIIRVERGDDGSRRQIDITVPPAFYYKLGMRMQMGQISAIRLHDSPAAAARLQARQADSGGKLLREGDLILRVEVPEPDGKVTVFEDKTLDPVRLPFELRRWADRYRTSKGFSKDDKLVKLKLRRHRDEPGAQFEIKDATLTWNDDWRFEKQKPFSLASPMPIPELGLAYQIKSRVADVEPGHPLQKDEEIKKVRLYYQEKDGKKDIAAKLKSDDQWARVFTQYQHAGGLPELTVFVDRDGELTEINVTGKEDETWPAEDRGLLFERDTRRQRADNMIDAVGMGFDDTWNNMVQVFANLRGMILGRISPENLGGPVTIAKIAYRIAGHDFWEFIFFIGMISVNLAVINFLPIPVLDGGHMVFLLYEKIRGKPASEGIRVGATYAGFALILSLMIYVLYLDFFVH